ncbi:MAG: sensor histidine kinase, partial [Kineothrix sp.]|nr:sensor histidine kinase [Kineothrix sp.]
SVPKLTLQPLVENAIYHGIKEKGETGILCVAGYLDNQRVVFEIYDTGTGISPQKIKELEDAVAAETDISNHFGLASVVKRLNIHYNNQAKLLIESKLSEYTCVTVSFPAEK